MRRRTGRVGPGASCSSPGTEASTTSRSSRAAGTACGSPTERPRESMLFGGYANASSELPAVVDQADGTVLSVKGSIDTISLAGRAVALIVVAAAGIYWVDRRRVEVSLLSAKGVGWPGLATKVLLETLPLAALAAAFGWLAGTWLVKGLGPTSVLDPV